jgi:hypothetical protein
MRRVMTRVRAGTVALAAVVALCACTGSEPSTGASPSDGGPTDVKALTAELLAMTPVEPVATGPGVLAGPTGGPVEVVVDVLEVRAEAESTELRWLLRGPGDEQLDVYTSALSRDLLFDTRQVGVEVDGRRLQAYTYDVPSSESDLGCACSRLPAQVGSDGRILTALLPPLPAGARTVAVVVPGVVVLEQVPVTRS